MTPEKIREMSDQELNATIAVDLFGWKWMSFVGVPVKGTPGYPTKCRVRQFMSPEQCKMKDWKEHFAHHEGAPATGDEPLAYGYYSSQSSVLGVPGYFTDMNAAMKVVEKLQDRFYFELSIDSHSIAKFISPNGEIVGENLNLTNPARAICEAALMAVMGDGETKGSE